LGKRAIVDLARLLRVQEFADRVWTHFRCRLEPSFSIPDKAA